MYPPLLRRCRVPFNTVHRLPACPFPHTYMYLQQRNTGIHACMHGWHKATSYVYISPGLTKSFMFMIHDTAAVAGIDTTVNT